MPTTSYERVSKNIAKGDPIKDIRELLTLAKEKKSVVVLLGRYKDGDRFMVRPAAVMLNWSLGQLMGLKMFYSIKLTF